MLVNYMYTVLIFLFLDNNLDIIWILLLAISATCTNIDVQYLNVEKQY